MYIDFGSKYRIKHISRILNILPSRFMWLQNLKELIHIVSKVAICPKLFCYYNIYYTISDTCISKNDEKFQLFQLFVSSQSPDYRAPKILAYMITPVIKCILFFVICVIDHIFLDVYEYLTFIPKILSLVIS